MKTRISTEVAHVTRDSDTIFKVKVKGQLAGAAALWRPTAQLVIIVIIIVAPCLFNAPASDSSSSGFVSGRGTTMRSGLNGVLGPRIPSRAIDSGVRSNASGAPLSMVTTCSMVRARTTLSAV